MAVDLNWFETLLATADLATRDTLEVAEVEIELPVATSGNQNRLRQWQRRVLSDIIPDSINADAPERTLFRVLYALTTGQKTQTDIETALSGDLAPLDQVFRAETRAKRKMTLAFHVLAVKAAGKGESDAKGFTERTLVLLCRRADGTVDAELLQQLVEQFRHAPESLDLAQKTVADKLYKGWQPSDEPSFYLPDSTRLPEPPFDSDAGRLFREDLGTLVRAALPPADFFQQLNLLLSLHLGLYQPRVAYLLNPQMEALFRGAAFPNPQHMRDLDLLLEKFQARHPFHSALACRAPDPDLRAVSLHTPARESFNRLSATLALFHFNILMLVQLRRLGEAWFAHKWGQVDAWRAGRLDSDIARELAARVRGPREFLYWMSETPDYATFLHRGMTALAVRFVQQQIAENDRDEAFSGIRSSPSAFHAMRSLYERYNIQASSNKSNSRAIRQGIQITSGLLRQGQYGLIQSRQRVGAFFEVGAGMLPLLLLLVVGSGREKVPVEAFWTRLGEYGLDFDPEERALLLERLRAMGVYERYSDAGEAAYVRNLMMTTRAA